MQGLILIHLVVLVCVGRGRQTDPSAESVVPKYCVSIYGDNQTLGEPVCFIEA